MIIGQLKHNAAGGHFTRQRREPRGTHKFSPVRKQFVGMNFYGWKNRRSPAGVRSSNRLNALPGRLLRRQIRPGRRRFGRYLGWYVVVRNFGRHGAGGVIRLGRPASRLRLFSGTLPPGAKPAGLKASMRKMAIVKPAYSSGA